VTVTSENDPPTVTVLAPNGGEQLDALTDYLIRWDSGDDAGVTATYILFSTDSGSTYPDTLASLAQDSTWLWSVPDVDETECRIMVVCFDAEGMQGSDESDGVFEIVGSATSVQNDVPSVLILHQNWPNPFNPVTKIEFGLPKAEMITLKIYNVEGRLVATLAEGFYEAGYHNEIWNGVNDNGMEVSSGVYFYRLVSSRKVITRKMVLLR